MILDSSALVAIALDEPERPELVAKINAAETVAVGAPTLVGTGIVTVAAILQVGVHAVEEIGAAYAAVYDWIEAHGTRDVGPPREVLLVGAGSGKPASEYVMEVQVPIEGVK